MKTLLTIAAFVLTTAMTSSVLADQNLASQETTLEEAVVVEQTVTVFGQEAQTAEIERIKMVLASLTLPEGFFEQHLERVSKTWPVITVDGKTQVVTAEDETKVYVTSR